MTLENDSLEIHSPTIDISYFNTVTFFIENSGLNSVIVNLQLTLNDIDYIDNFQK